MLTEKYVNPFTDYGFKRLFGEEVNKELLIDFLNELLHKEQGKIKKLTYLKNEKLGVSELDRRAIFDLYCENEKGEKFIVELQKTKQKFFKDRTYIIPLSLYANKLKDLTGTLNLKLFMQSQYLILSLMMIKMKRTNTVMILNFQILKLIRYSMIN